MTSSTHAAPPDDPVGRYLEVGLRLGRHLDGMVDAYYGPEALAERVFTMIIGLFGMMTRWVLRLA